MRTKRWPLLIALLFCVIELLFPAQAEAQRRCRRLFRSRVVQQCPEVTYTPVTCESHPVILSSTRADKQKKEFRKSVQNVLMQGDGDGGTWRSPGQTVKDSDGNDVQVKVQLEENHNGDPNYVLHKVYIKIYSDLSTPPRTPIGLAGVVELPAASCTEVEPGVLEALFDNNDGVPTDQDIRVVAWIEYHSDLLDSQDTVFSRDSVFFTMSP